MTILNDNLILDYAANQEKNMSRTLLDIQNQMLTYAASAAQHYLVTFEVADRRALQVRKPPSTSI